MHDAVVATPGEIKQLQVNQDFILKNSFAQYAEDEYLDDKLYDVGLTRFEASPNKRTVVINADAGVILPKGHSLSTLVLDENQDPIEFSIDDAVSFQTSGSIAVKLTCKTLGSIGNLVAGSEFTLLPPIAGVRSIVDSGTDILGTDREDNESAWNRYDFKVKNPDTGGNKNDYRRWAGEITGVGASRVIPRWNGRGTVKVVIVDADYQPATSVLVEELQEYLDPGQTGLGEGKAPCGAQVTAVTASGLAVNVTAVVEFSEGYDPAAVKVLYEEKLTDYLKELVFKDKPVVYNKVGALLIGTDGVSNYTDLSVNGATNDVLPGLEEVAIVGQVTI
ncbi:baseplate J/gp47 family protein [Cytobacillus praedii]|uniref:baseplate J/gp47 family protein n=1 Tax=Cytobacillus praedii TaxID=1742358 RepID=UPI002E206381|nr:baseplate J/gp47 family protein [Cytobacillus praedii]